MLDPLWSGSSGCEHGKKVAEPIIRSSLATWKELNTALKGDKKVRGKQQDGTECFARKKKISRGQLHPPPNAVPRLTIQVRSNERICDASWPNGRFKPTKGKNCFHLIAARCSNRDKLGWVNKEGLSKSMTARRDRMAQWNLHIQEYYTFEYQLPGPFIIIPCLLLSH